MGLSKMSGEAPWQETADRYFHLLTDLFREVEKFREPAQKLEALLLVLLGSLGASCGFLWTRESSSGREHWIDRGIPPAEAENWKTLLPGFLRDLQPAAANRQLLSFFRSNDRPPFPPPDCPTERQYKPDTPLGIGSTVPGFFRTGEVAPGRGLYRRRSRTVIGVGL